MSQDSNTTDGSEPTPRLHGRKPDEPTPASPETPAPATGGSGAVASPRLSFAPKKRVEEPAPAHPVAEPPVANAPPPAATAETNEPHLKRPPQGTRLVAASDTATTHAMPAPLSAANALTNSPFAPAKPAKARGNLALWIALFVLVLIVGGESAYLLMQDEPAETAPAHKPPVLVIGSNPAGKPIDVATNGSAAPTPIYAYLQSLNPEIASGTDPRLFINNETYHLGQVIDPEFGVRWVRIDDKTRELEFVDKKGQHYIKKF